MPDLDSPDPAPKARTTPPPLPRKVALFKIGGRLGFWFGVIQCACFLLLSLIPGEPLPLSFFIAMAAAALEAFSALLVLRHRNGSRGIFTGASVVLSFCYLTLDGIIFGILNLIPLLLLVASSSPDAAAPASKDDASGMGDSSLSTELPRSKEDLY